MGRAIALGAIPVVVAAAAGLLEVGWIAERGSEVDADRVVFESNRAASVTFGPGETGAVYAFDGPNGQAGIGRPSGDVAGSTVTCQGEPDGLVVTQTRGYPAAAIDRNNDWVQVALLVAERPGSHSVSCNVTDSYWEDYAEGHVLTLAIADQDPGSKLRQRLSITLYLLGALVLLLGTPTTGFVLLFWGGDLWHGQDHWFRTHNVRRVGAQHGP